jgi:hypothetical protein
MIRLSRLQKGEDEGDGLFSKQMSAKKYQMFKAGILLTNNSHQVG